MKRGMGRIRKLLEAGGLPDDALFDSARVTMTGRASVMIEGQHGIVELTDVRIRLKTGGGILVVSGSGLALSALSPEQAVVTGDAIDAVAYS